MDKGRSILAASRLDNYQTLRPATIVSVQRSGFYRSDQKAIDEVDENEESDEPEANYQGIVRKIQVKFDGTNGA